MSGVKAGRMSEDIRRIISAKMRDLKEPEVRRRKYAYSDPL